MNCVEQNLKSAEDKRGLLSSLKEEIVWTFTYV